MARRRSKKKSSNKLLKTAILLILFIGIWFIYNLKEDQIVFEIKPAGIKAFIEEVVNEHQ